MLCFGGGEGVQEETISDSPLSPQPSPRRGEGDFQRSSSQRAHESDEALPVLFGELGEFVARGLALAAVPKNSLGEGLRAPVMQK